jgi:hypothetical protein
MYFYQIKCCFYTQNGCMNKNILLLLIPSQNTRSIQQTPNPMFHGCTIANLNIAINKLRVRRVKFCALNTFEIAEQQQVCVRRC